MKKFLYIIILFNCSVQAQDLTRYFDFMRLMGEDFDEYEEVEFKWNMKGNVQVLLNEGLNYLREGQIDASIAHLDSLVKIDSSLWMVYYYRGVANQLINRFVDARRDLKKSISLNKDVPATYIKLGDLLVISLNFSNAESNYQKSIELNPNYAKGYYKLGNVNLYQGQDRKALKYYSKALEINSSFAAAFVPQGILKFRAKRNDNQALEYFNNAIRADSTYALAYFWRGFAYSSVNQKENCLNDFNTAVKLNPNNGLFLSMRAFLKFEMKRYEEAFHDFRKILERKRVEESNYQYEQTSLDKQLDMQFAVNYTVRNSYGLQSEALSLVHKACCYILTNDYSTALSDLNAANKLDKSPSIIFLKAIAFEHQDKHDSAFSNYSKALAMDPDIYDAYKKRAIYRYELKDWKGAYADLSQMHRIQPKAQATYRLGALIKTGLKDYYGGLLDAAKFLKNDTSDFEMWKTEAYCRLQIKDYKGAIEDYWNCITINEKAYEIYEAIENTQYLKGDTLGARETMHQVVKVWPDDIGVRIDLIENFIMTKNYDSAQHYLSPLLSKLKNTLFLVEEHAICVFLQGKIYLLQGRIEDGIKQLEKSTNISPNSLQIHHNRAVLYIRFNQENKAIKDLKFLKRNNYKPAEDLYLKYNII